MPLELCLTFPDPSRVSVALRGEIEGDSRPVDFASPLTEDDQKELRWYVEDYGTGYRAEPDDQRAATVRDKLPVWGAELFAAVFQTDDEAAKLFGHFLEAKKEGRILSIAADHPAVLSLPWELLVAPGRSFLFNENPPISIRRGLPAAEQESARQPGVAKPVLRLLFIISRPDRADFINPRSDAEAVLTALEQQEATRVEVEFLRLATLAELKERLLDSTKASIDIIHFDGHGVLADSDSAGKEGRLLFESEWGGIKGVSGKELGDLLNSNHTGLVVLSACQSAMMDSEDPMSGVAAQLVHAGIPAVIAMSYSALVTTTELLFAEFYRSLFKGRTVARSLDEARHVLCSNLERGKRLRGAHNAQEITLELHDWFLPALYQSGADQPLLSTASDESLSLRTEPLHNLPDVQESGFFGRSWELWQIERFFAVNNCRRISITGFGGQGKTALALEAGRWLLRTKLFQRACLVRFDSYQGSDPVNMVVSTMSAVFEESLPDAAAAEASLERVPTLLILDNLETLADSGTLAELLDAAAQWSEAGESRVLLTSRQPDFQHLSYPLASKREHRHIALQGLHEDDAVDWFDEMYRLPPEAKQPRPQRDVLVSLFEKVSFHPLSIGLLAQQIKERRPAELGERLETLLEEQPVDREDRTLLASLELSLERLPEQCREWLPRLGVFVGGGLEELVQGVTEIEEADWQELRRHLLRSGLMREKRVLESDEMIFLRFHPTLTPALWQKLGKEEQASLLEGYWQAYYQFSGKLYKLDNKNPHAARAIAQHELPNLLRAAHIVLQSDKTEEGMDFADNVNRFLRDFGMLRDWQELTEVAAKAGGTVGSQAWFVSRSNLGEQHFHEGKPKHAEAIFTDILKELGTTPSYNRCLALGRLGRCFRMQGQQTQAEQLYRQELVELPLLEHNEEVRRETGFVQTELADVLRNKGDLSGAKKAYQAGLKIAKEQDDKRNAGTILGQLGTLACVQGELIEAAERYIDSLALFHSIGELASEAAAWHNLGIVYQEATHWGAAEQAYRKAAQLKAELGLLGGINGACASWQQLAQICDYRGRQAEAEQWFRKALATCRTVDDRPGMALTLNNLASFLANDPVRLAEARGHAEEALAMLETLNPAAAEIWRAYDLLAHIAAQQGDSSKAAEYRAKSRHAYFAFLGWRQQLHQHEPMIAAMVQATTDPAMREKLEQDMNQSSGGEWANSIAAHRRILDGERDEAALCELLNYEEAAIIRAILEGIEGQE